MAQLSLLLQFILIKNVYYAQKIKCIEDAPVL